MNLRAPNTWTVAGLSLFVGALVGVSAALLESASRPWRIGDFIPATINRPGAAVAEVEVLQTVYDFGTVGLGVTGFHEFVIGNTGTAPLSLKRGATSCICTVSDFETIEGKSSVAEKIVAPGATTKVKVQWRGKGESGPFRQKATILTNDPRREEIAFVVEGSVVPTWKAAPEAIVLTNVSRSSGQRATVKIFTFGPQPPEVDTLTVSHTTGPQAAQLFSLSTALLDPAEIKAETGATGGFLLSVDVNPGLPIGPLRHTIQMVFRIPEEVTAEVPLVGEVTGDLALAGTAWDSSRQALSLGTVSSRSGLHTQLFLTVKGPHRIAVRPVVREVVPQSLEVLIGEAKPVGNGAVLRIPITVSVAPGSPTVNHLCSPQAPAGKIVLETAHPDTPTLTIPVCIAIGP